MVTIRSNDGNAFDARVDIEANAVVLHSRSGTSRNRDYRPALEMILARLADNGVKPDVYLDSNRVDHLPLSQRRILSGAQLTGAVAEQFAQIVRAMNEGRASNGAWSKVRLPAALIGAAAGATIFASAPAVVAGILALIGAALTALMTFLNPSERAAQHQKAGVAYSRLRRTLRQFVQIDMMALDAVALRTKLTEFTDEICKEIERG